MPTYAVHIDVRAEPAVAYDFVADLARHGEWSADPLEVRATGEDTFRSVGRSKGKTIEAELRVLERAPHARFEFEATDLTGRWVHTFTFTPMGSGTKIERSISGSLSGAQLALFWLVLFPVKKPNARRALTRLKQALESGP